MAPPPPPAEKRTRLMTPSEAADPETVSLLMMFDDLVRNQKVKGKAEARFEFNMLKITVTKPSCFKINRSSKFTLFLFCPQMLSNSNLLAYNLIKSFSYLLCSQNE